MHTIEGVRLTAASVVTGQRKVALDDERAWYGGDQARIERLKKATGLDTRWVADGGVTAVDLAEQAVRRLADAGACSPGDISTLIFVTQTPDHFQPCNAAILHGRLGLPKAVAAFDLNLGCSGWLYGLCQAASLVATGAPGPVLLVAGDCLSRQINPRDRALAPLFGDAAAATVVSGAGRRIHSADTPDATPAMHFQHFTDGGNWTAIRVPGGGSRLPFGSANADAAPDAEGNWRSELDLFMDGPEVFKFTLREVPGAIHSLLGACGIAADAVDGYYLHQANGFILDNLRRRLKVAESKLPKQTVARYGNLSSASIPAVLCDAFADGPPASPHRAVLAGYGVGLSWSVALTDLGNIRCLPVIPYSP